MRPTLAAEQVRDSLSQYLSTTYALADESTRRALEHFLGDAEDGIFRGPYLRIRTPFRQAEGEGWQRHLTWWPRGFRPHRHQELAWERLSTLHGPASPTLVTTGTGSGKTESFLVPLLDHCRREREAGREGVKAVLLYPMNALATDQAHRINDYLDNPRDARLRDAGVRAALYIGDKASKEFKQANPRVAVDRDEIRRTRPDILITNYKMLDLLLQRPEDQRLWQTGTGSGTDSGGDGGSALAYVVLDEFHTYDGAQGTDVAMLLRRLGSVTGLAERGRPLGPVCPVATSATLGEGGTGGPAAADGSAGSSLTDVAEQVFGVPFPPGSLVGEDRRSAQEFAGASDFALPFPSPHEVAALGDPTRDREALDQLAAEFTGKTGLTAEQLGRQLRRHRLTAAVLEILDGSPRTMAEVLEVLPRYAYHWGVAVQQNPALAARALARYVALLSTARDPDHPGAPLLSIEIHHWVRSVSRVLRGISAARAEFRWDDERVASSGKLTRTAQGGSRAEPGPADGIVGDDVDAVDDAPVAVPAQDSAVPPAQVFLPAVFCRECGRSGWAALSPEADPAELDMNATKIRRASVGRDKRRVRNMIAATAQQAYEAAFAAEKPRGGPAVLLLDGLSGRLRALSPESDFEAPGGDGTGDGPRVAKALHDGAFVWTDLADDRAAQRDQCPACRTHNAIRYLGTGLAALAAASITQLFTGGELDRNLKEDKTLLFNDSVQDAAHRAGYVASRSYTFSFRSLLASRIDEEEPIALSDLAADLITDVVDSKAVQAAVIPPDLHVVRGVDTLLAGRSRGSEPTWELIAQRLAFAAVLEFGLRSRQGRTLELTRTVAADVPLQDPDAVAGIVRELLHTTPGEIALPDGSVPGPDQWIGHVRGLLQRLRTRGAIRHAWLDDWIGQAGVRRWLVWGGRRTGMPAFPPGVSAPSFLLGSPKQGSDDFDVVTGRLGWYQDWTRRSLGLRPDTANAFLVRLLPALAEAGVLSARTAKDGATRVYGLQPGHVQVRKLADDSVAEASAHCPFCSWEQTIHPELADQWHGLPCPRYRCGGRLRTGQDPESGVRRRDFTEDFYRRMYRDSGVFTINTAEHTGTLSRPQREAVEKAFRAGTEAHYANPQVLSCTPTLELGIDIGDLSAVVLASLPKGPGNYVQRVGRAGRATGNAYLLTMVDRGPRDRYYLDDPRQMIAGDIRPPGCFLSAIEILRRQYLAHLLDLAGAGRLLATAGGSVPRNDLAPQNAPVPVLPLPHLATGLFGPSAWLNEFREAALADGAHLAESFLALFPPYDEKKGTGVSPQAADELRAYATEGLAGALNRAREQWEHRRGEMKRRIDAIDTAHKALVSGDPEHERQGRELRAERRAVAGRAREISNTTAHGALVDLGLLPNYSLVDSVTELEATLTWREETAGEGAEYHSKVLKYDRSARLALQDFAPGNHYYVQGYKHRITGLDIGSPGRPAWAWWRVCPDCGYVRTERAQQDSSPCPRCGSAAIGDVGCVHKVLVPHRAMARDQRDDVRVRDDTDERERRHYTVVPAVDIPGEGIEEAWKHKRATFGWEFTRRAVIRHLNVGASRVEGGADDAFAGRRVRLNPFWVCDSCGYADPDGGPAAEGQETLVPGRETKYHRPWCPRRREELDGDRDAQPGVRLLLAHELHSEALRILIPAVTAYTQERLVSFKAVLLAGIARSYGGDPDHLAVVTDSMPERGSDDADIRRHFLVLYDTLPGGTGYLHRLSGPDGLHDVLTRARQVIESCVCVAEGRPACHRCLLRHVEDSEYEFVSREHALDMLGELLGRAGDGWDIEETATTREITLVRQVESELEALFRRGLLAWAERVDEVSVRTALTPDGARDTTLRFTAPGGEVSGWRMETQTDLGFTVPDVVFRSIDDDRRRVAVYLDGFRYHASPGHNRIADDAAKRTRLRSTHGWQVFQLTWDDVRAWAGQSGPPAEPVWVPYQNTAQKTASDIHRRLHGGDPRDLPRFVWSNPVETLIGYLTSPDPDVWRHRAQSSLAGFAAVSATSRALAADGPETGRRIADALAGKRLSGGQGAIQVMATKDSSGCPLTIALDLRNGQAEAAWTALTVLDDSPETVGGDESAHRRRWQAWLYWTNLLQFLNAGGGDGVQLTERQLSGFDPVELAVTGGAGWLESHRRAHVPEEGRADTARSAGEAQRAARQWAETPRDPAWDEVISYLMEEPGLAELADNLAALGVPAPEAGFELGAAAWPAELAWPAHRIGVVLTHQPGPDGTPDRDAEDRDRAYAKAGWHVRTATEWDAREIADALTRPAGAGDRPQANDDEEHDG